MCTTRHEELTSTALNVYSPDQPTCKALQVGSLSRVADGKNSEHIQSWAAHRQSSERVQSVLSSTRAKLCKCTALTEQPTGKALQVYSPSPTGTWAKL
ncbi:hypothetical protein NDU88_002227 [Pleurodeles waltl]|uniref:Uncharacterized protein n=1 Tax=Pleurodeles waltl TaxID=8319 RepID=A0AAV7MV28_PLEWA|nr:hypothetical protein NDU88_002227 [Pleurodeles waltl]